MPTTYETIIGLEIHVQMNTKTKLFCTCDNDSFNKEPNTNVCEVCMGFPGTLPVTNKEAIEKGIISGLALNCTIPSTCKFDRKHYFYPDLPKGFQITQYDEPIAINGHIEITIDSKKKIIGIERLHLEDDAGKLIHANSGTLVDYNRSGTPLMEIVSKPDLRSKEEASAYARSVQQIMRFVGSSDADMEKGSMRLEANISLTNKKGAIPDYKVELKNINSFRFLKKAIDSEIERQKSLLEKGEKIVQETRGYSEKTGKTVSQRSKEEAHDYRYFPEPDIPPITVSDSEIQGLKHELPELPWVKRERFKMKYSLSDFYTDVLTDTMQRADYFEAVVKLSEKYGVGIKTIANLMVNQNLDSEFDEPADLVLKIYELTKKEFAPEEEVIEVVKKIVSKNQDAVAKFQKGKGEIVGFLIGQVQKDLKGKGDPKIIRQLLLQYMQNG